ncbi:toxin-antitoxin system YwqK family antitoxin [Niabella hibiscisoli]|uniref:toxin-antitoxin system YwqK family antitoxin n=1 Tax=Niabella hibiscisoli TaxID=1825928 RepID=UPI001F0F1FEF|nr:toxin-antitoxin system YwqK family antitoxin [Niabella hibiscisoli]MCH5720447.1 toxin-antitoxin system YwqK family antitoxin [Niabella hibiscisoli]
MKRILTLLSFSLPTLFVSAQEVKDINWDQVRRKYNSDSSRMELSLNNIPLSGVYKQRFDDGSYGLYNVKNGLITGDVLWYNVAGKVSARMGYKNGVRHGKKENYDGQGKIWLKENYLNGKQDGVTEMNTSGSSATTYYKQGKREGLATRYVNGKISSEENYKNGLKDGISRTYINGELNSETNYKQGLKDGLSRTYTMGQPAMETMYKNGKRNGLFTMYANGTKTQDAYYVDDKRQGPSRMYKPDGTVLFTNYFFNDQKITKEAFEKRSK